MISLFLRIPVQIFSAVLSPIPLIDVILITTSGLSDNNSPIAISLHTFFMIRLPISGIPKEPSNS